MSLYRWIAVTLALHGACTAVDHNTNGRHTHEQAIQMVDAVGTGGSAFFPLGIYYEGTNQQDPNYEAAAPKTSADARQYYRETLQQLKSLGINALVHSNAEECHSDEMLWAATQVGGIYVIHHSQTNLAWPVDHASVRGFASQAVSRFSPSPALLGYQIKDEPLRCHLPAVRWMAKYENYFEQVNQSLLHGCFGALTTWFGDKPIPAAPPAPPCQYVPSWLSIQERVTACDQVMAEEKYPLLPETPENLAALEGWGDYITMQYQAIPADKPMYSVIQAHRWLGGEARLRHPTPRELRYMTYAALARGAKGIFWFMYQKEHDSNDDQQHGGIADIDFSLNENAREIKALTPKLKSIGKWLADARRDDQIFGSPSVATVPSSPTNQHDLVPFRTSANEELLVLVNQSMSTRTFTVNLTANNPYLQNLFLKGPVAIRNVVTEETTTCPALPGCSFSQQLVSGEGAVFQLQSSLASDIRVSRGAYTNPIASGKSIKITASITNNGTTSWNSSHHLGVTKVVSPSGSVFVPSGVTGNSFPAAVVPIVSGKTELLTLSVPTGPGTNIQSPGTYTFTIDMYHDGPPATWFGNSTMVSIMVAPNPLFVDTFDLLPFNKPSTELYRWEVDSSRYSGAPSQLRSGALAVNGSNSMPSYAQGQLVAWPKPPESAWSDYTLEFDVLIDLESTNPRAGWMARASDAGNGYVFRLDQPSNSLQRFTLTSNQLTSAGTVPVNPALSLAKNVWYHVKQEFLGNSVTTSVRERDNPSSPTFTNNWTSNAFSSGRIGIFVSEDLTSGNPELPSTERAHFDNFFVHNSATNSTAPAAVTLPINPATATGLAMSLNWDADRTSSGAKVSHYRLYRSTTSGFTPGPTNLVGEPAANVFVNTNVTPGVTYFYRVKAVSHADVEGTASAQFGGAIPAVPQQPTILSAVADDMKSVTLSWNGTATKFEIHRGDNGFIPSSSTLLATVTGNSYLDTTNNSFVGSSQIGLDPFRTYYYRVIPKSASDASGPVSEQVPVTTPGSRLFTACVPPSPCTVTQMTSLGGTSKFGDLVAEFTAHLSIADNHGDWLGMTIRKTSPTHVMASGFLVYYRKSGIVEIFDPSNGVVASKDTGLAPTTPRRVRIEATGQFIKVFVDGTIFIDYWNPVATWVAPGYVDIISESSTAVFTGISISARNAFNRDSFNRENGSVPTNWTKSPSFNYDTQSSAGSDKVSWMGITPPTNTLWYSTPKELRVADFTADITLKVTNDQSPSSWGAFAFRKTNESDSPFATGYMVYLRANGQLNLFSAGVGDIATIATGTCELGGFCANPTSCSHRLRVSVVGTHIRVWLDGVLRIDTIDNRWTAGAVSLVSYGASTQFESFEIF